MLRFRGRSSWTPLRYPAPRPILLRRDAFINEMMDARGLGTDDVTVRTHVVFLHFQSSSRIVAIPPFADDAHRASQLEFRW